MKTTPIHSWQSDAPAFRAIDLACCWAFQLRRASRPAPGCADSVLGCAVRTPAGRRRMGRHLLGITEVKPPTQVADIPRKPNLPASKLHQEGVEEVGAIGCGPEPCWP